MKSTITVRHLILLMLTSCLALAANSLDIKYQSGFKPFDIIENYEFISTLNKLKQTPNNNEELLFDTIQTNEKLRKAFVDTDRDFVLKWFLDYESNARNIFNVSTACNQQLTNLADNLMSIMANLSNPASILFSPDSWSLRVVDSFGKIPSGILNGGLFAMGDYDECLSASNAKFESKYCLFSNSYSQTTLNQFSFVYSLALCLPKVCSSDEISRIVNSIIPLSIQLSISPFPGIVTCQEEYPLDSIAITAIVIISIIVLLVLSATAFEIYKVHFCNSCKVGDILELNNNNGDEKLKIKMNGHSNGANQDSKKEAINNSKSTEIFLALSAYTASKKIFDLKSAEGQIDSLNAIRFLTLGWVILCHCYSFTFGIVENKTILFELDKRFSFSIISTGFFSVDSFFVLSGFLTAHLFLKEFKDKEFGFRPLFLLKYYFHRYWRLTPTYAICLLISVGLTPYIGAGPFHPGQNGYEPDRCSGTWWTNLLYINNLGISDPGCFGESWYLANDFQYHLLSPLILIPLASKKMRNKMIGVLTCISLIIACVITTVLILDAYPGAEQGIYGPRLAEYFTKVYIKPWTRIIPYLVGILLAFVLSLKRSFKDFKLDIKLNLALWCVALLTLFFSLFGLSVFFTPRPAAPYKLIIFESVTRLSWSLGLAYVMFACITPNGLFIGKMFSWSVWKPLARLNYCAYLIHVDILFYKNYNMKRLFYLDDTNMIWLFCANMVFTYSLAYIFTIFFEAPFIRLEKFIFRRRK